MFQICRCTWCNGEIRSSVLYQEVNIHLDLSKCGDPCPNPCCHCRSEGPKKEFRFCKPECFDLWMKEKYGKELREFQNQGRIKMTKIEEK
jgi:hypothetical protein